MKFTKMHGCGNDYILINDIENKIENPSELAIKLSDRHYGVGSDGLIIVKKSRRADFRMKMYNVDGSIGKMCGNGIRCFGKFVYEKELTKKIRLKIETDAGIRNLMLQKEERSISKIMVDMGMPSFFTRQIPVNTEKKIFINEELEGYHVSCVSMGNPHLVTFIEDIENLNINKIGKIFENHEMFPDRINVEFAQIIDENNIKVRVWERGSGETLACGTGACAVTAVGYINGMCSSKTNIILSGGELKVNYDMSKKKIFLMGEATTVFEGFI